MCSECGNHNFASREACNRCGAPKLPPPPVQGQQMLHGDWICPACGNHNFAKREACNKCGEPKSANGPPPRSAKGGGKGGGYGKAAEPMRSYSAPPPYSSAPPVARRGPPPPQMDDRGNFREGDWVCHDCGNHNFASRSSCNRCGEPKPPERYGAAARPGRDRPSPYAQPSAYDRPSPYASPRGPPPMAAREPPPSQGCKGGKGGPPMRDGDWICPACSNHNFASRDSCNRCGQPRDAPPNFRPGDWMCKECKNHNFASKNSCNRCGAPKP